jgi:hypothetical protein
MYETQLLKIRIRPGMTEKVIAFMETLRERQAESLEALRREGMMVESIFLERGEEADYLYYYVKAANLAHANEINMKSNDALTREIRKFVSDTWAHIASPEPLLDLDLIPEAPRKLRAAKPRNQPNIASPHVLAGG